MVGMGHVVDYTGQAFGELTVLERAKSRPVGAKGKTKGYWLCRCSCGRSCEVSTDNLRCGFTRSCGHLTETPHNRSNLTGRKFGRLTVVRQSLADSSQQSLVWECQCDCGNTRTVATGNLTSGNSKSCGCLRVETAITAGLRRRRHGHNTRNSPTYRSWSQMRKRCKSDLPRYGGRGIVVDPRWESFENFLADMGERPIDCTLDRVNNDGPYSPGNCRWATQITQSNNRYNHRWVTYQGRTQTVAQWAREVGMSRGVLNNRIKGGWDVERALTTPVLKWR